MRFSRGDTCYIVESNMNVRLAKVINRSGNLYTIQFIGSCGAIRLPEGRLFQTEEEAAESIHQDKKVEVKNDFPDLSRYMTGRNRKPDLH